MSGLEFLAPIGLMALIGIPLVILFHMRHTTPVVRPVPSLRFWREAPPAPTDDARLRRPPISLLLLLQLLAVGALGLALARPAVADALAGLTQRTEPEHLLIVLDGSTSMGATDTADGRSRFDHGRSVAIDRLATLRDGDVATMLVMGATVRTSEATDRNGFRALQDRLRAMPLPGGRADLDAALSLANNLILPGMDDRIVVITDGAISVDPLLAERLGAPVELVQIGQPNAANLAVVELTASPTGVNGNRLAVLGRISNFGPETVTVPVALLADGVEIESQPVTIGGHQTVELNWDLLPAGAARIRLQIAGADALAADDTAELVLDRDSDLAQRILLVSDTPLLLQHALGVLPGAQVTTVSTTEYLSGVGAIGAVDLLVFEHFTPTITADLKAPVLFVHPPIGGLLPIEGVMPSASVQYVRSGDPLVRGIDIGRMSVGETPIHTLDANATAVVEGESGPLIYRGIVPGTTQPMVVVAFDLQGSLLAQRVAFPMLMTNIVRTLAPVSIPATVALGDTVVMQPRAGVATIRVTTPAGATTDLAVTTSASGLADPVLFGETGQAGEYLVVELDGRGSERGSGAFTIDAGHPLESNLTANAELPAILATAGADIAETGATTRLGDLWPVLALLALVVLAFEWIWASGGSGIWPRLRLPGRVAS